MVEKLRKSGLVSYLYFPKSRGEIIPDANKRKLNLPKSNSFSLKTESNKKRLLPLFTTQGKIQNTIIENKLKKNNAQLKLNIHKYNKEIILAKSAEHKKIFELKQKEKLLKAAIDIKKLSLQEPGNFHSTLNSDTFLQEKEDEIIEKSFQSNLLYKIKKQYFNLEKDYKNKVNEIAELKNNIKRSKNNELDMQNKKILNDYVKLKESHEINMNKNNEYKIEMKDYIELEDKLTKKNFIILELQEQLKQATNSNICIENDIEEMKLKLKSLEIENKNLNNQFELLNENYNIVEINKKEIENKLAKLIEDERQTSENIIFNNSITE